MAHSLSSAKRMRQNVKRRALNRARKTVLKGQLRTCRQALTRGSADEAQKAAHDASRALDRAASQRTIHRNAAARRKSRIARKLNAVRQKAAK